MPDADPVVKAVAHKQAVAPRTFDIGKVIDSDDDMDRLMIGHPRCRHESGEGVRLFRSCPTNNRCKTLTTLGSGTKIGKITVDDNDADTVDTDNTALM